MSIFGRLLAEIVEGAVDAVELSMGIAKDIAKAPIRVFDRATPIGCDEFEDFTEDTQEAIERIKEKP